MSRPRMPVQDDKLTLQRANNAAQHRSTSGRARLVPDMIAEACWCPRERSVSKEVSAVDGVKRMVCA